MGLGCFVSTPIPTFAQQSTVMVQPDFAAAPLRDIAVWFAEVTGENLVFVPDTLGDRTITIITPRPIPLADVSDLLVAVLSMHGLVLEDRGAFSIIREP